MLSVFRTIAAAALAWLCAVTAAAAQTAPATPDVLRNTDAAAIVPAAVWVSPPPVADKSTVVPDST